MSSAATTALSIPKLLQNILQHLSLPDLLLSAPLVCRTWHAAILTSPLLQKQLFFAPSPASPRTVNPFLASKFAALFDKPYFAHPLDVPTSTQGSHAAFWYAMKRAIRRYVIQAEDLWGMECFASNEAMAAYFYPGATWRRMLVVQPPVTVMRASRDGPTGRQPECLTMELWFDGMVQAMRASLKSDAESWGVSNNLWKEGREMMVDWGSSRTVSTSAFRGLFGSEWLKEKKKPSKTSVEQGYIR
jgi:hypothetical protein